MDLPSIHISLVICMYCLIVFCQGANYGDDCTSSSCDAGYQTCDSTCRCVVGYTVNTAGDGCVGGLGKSCTSALHCADPAAICTSGICTCNTTTHYDSNGSGSDGTCTIKKSPGEECPHPNTGILSTASCMDTNSECKLSGSYLCQCIDGFNNVNGQCVQNSELGKDCTTEENCADPAAICTSSKCTCDTTTQYDSNGSVDGGTCTTKKALGAVCPSLSTSGVTSTASCSDTNAVCQQEGSTQRCRCSSNYYDNDGNNNEGGQCTDKKALGAVCPSPSTSGVTSTASCSDTNAACQQEGGTYRCRCSSNYYDNDNNQGGQCTDKVTLGGTCPSDVSASLPCSDSNAECINTNSGYKCQCKSGYYDNDGDTGNVGGTCEQIISYGGQCTAGGDVCAGDNTECSGGTCQCVGGYYWNNAACVIKKQLSDSCPQPNNQVPDTEPCADTNARCQLDSGNYKCQCMDTHYDNDGTSNVGGSCTIKKQLSDSCPTPNNQVPDTESCADTNARCKLDSGNYKCQCIDTHYDNDGTSNVGGSCTIKKQLNESCPEPNNPVLDTESCVRTNARCKKVSLNNYKCQCLDTHYDDDGTSNVGGLCQIKKALGAECPSTSTSGVTSTASCSDTNAACQLEGGTYKCRCSSNYYDNDGNDSVGGQCTNKKALGAECPSTSTSGVTSTASCSDTNAACQLEGGTYKCRCSSNYYDNDGNDSVGGQCTNKKALGAECPSTSTSGVTSTASCSDTNAACQLEGGTYKCRCSSNYYDNDGNDSVGGQCTNKKALGAECPSTSTSGVTSTASCSDTNAACQLEGGTYKCRCSSNYYDNDGNDSVGGQCTNKKALGAECPSTSTSGVTSTASCSDTNAACQLEGGTYKCRCSSNYYDNDGNDSVGGQCTNKVELGRGCPKPTAYVPKSATCSDGVATCEDDGGVYKCKCPDTYYDDNGINYSGGQCIPKKQLSDSCPQPNPVLDTESCADTNAKCKWNNGNYKCQCIDTHYDNDGTSVGGGSCTIKKVLGAVCPSPSTSGVSSTASCSDTNAACQHESGTYRCRCSSNYYDNDGNDNVDGQCATKVGLGYVCPMEDACFQTNSHCVSGTCVCKIDYYDSNTDTILEGTCKNRKELGALCNTASPYNTDQCKAQSAACYNTKCACNAGYHQEDTICKADNANGETCTGSVSGECSDPNAQCTDLKCTCGLNYYDDNGLGIGGKCEPVSQLQVGSVVFSDIQTTSVTVSWSHPPGDFAGYVNSYSVRWTLKNTVNYDQSNSLPSSTTKYVVTGITAGKAYNVEIISHNTQTESGEERTTSLTKQQAAKPNMIGSITSSGADLDVSDGNLRLVFTAANNGKSGYIVQLFDDTTKIAEKTPGQYSTGVTIQNNYDVNSNYRPLKNGYRYKVKIITLSETFDSGKKVRSDEFEDVIKTTPKTPNQPESGQCGGVSDNAITVSWNPPAIPNGDIVRYHVWVYLNDQHNFTRSTNGSETGLIVDGLQPGTSYQFTLVTQNEVGNSLQTGYISTGCKTKAKMAEAPNNLQLLNVTSRSMNVTWEKPSELYSEENFGYYLQIKNDKDTCVIEILFQCSDCNFGIFQISELTDVCTTITQQTELRTKEQLAERMSYTANLDPDILYTVTVTAINDAGRGYETVVNETTLEEAPKTPTSVSISDIGSKTFTLSWSIDGPRPGKTFFDIKVDAISPAKSMVEPLEGFNNRSFVVTGLQEYWNYSVSVIAKTSKGSKESDVRSVRTFSAAPGKVSEFIVTPHPGGNYTQMQVSWKAPTILERNGIIEEYNFEHNATVTESNSVERYGQDTSMEHVYEKMLSVTPETYYRFQVTAMNDEDETGEPFEQIVEAPAGKPINIEESLKVEVIPPTQVNNVQQTRLNVKLVRDFFRQSQNGNIRSDGLIVCKGECSLGEMSLSYFNKIENWINSQNGVKPWRPTKPDWLDELSNGQRRRRSVADVDYTLGAEDCSNVPDDTYCNGPLQADTTYYLVAVVCTNGGCTLSKEYGPFKTEAVPPKQPMWIIGVVVGVVVVAVIVVVLFVVFIRRRRGPKQMDPVTHGGKTDGPELDPITASIPRKRPINLENMASYVQNMHRDSNLLFAREYEDLKTLSPKHPCEAADREENRLKNRYINIIPFDNTRVKLTCMDEDDTSDYMNANYLPGYTFKREYIGCQGAIPGTIDDFWRMVWEQNVSICVMLTLCKEGQKIKCEQYWPDEIGDPKQYGDVVVEVTTCSTIRTYDYRTFKMTRGDTTRIMKHFHFLSWLDFQANVSHDIILDFIDQVRSHVQPPDTSGPIIVHCSAGVGRTGTYICLDHLTQLIRDSDFNIEIDIFDMVLNLRNNRQHMVQTEQQYIFIHDCVLEIMERKRKAANIYENTAFSNDEENIYQNDEVNLYANVPKNEQKTVL